MFGLTQTECAYLAGLLDGEGFIGLLKSGNSHGINITIDNTNFELLYWLQRRIPFGKVYKRQRKSNYKPQWTWAIRDRKNAYTFLIALRPYMIVKAAQADAMLALLNVERMIGWKGCKPLPDDLMQLRVDTDKQLKCLRKAPTLAPSQQPNINPPQPIR